MTFNVTITQGYDHINLTFDSIDNVLTLIQTISKDHINETTIRVGLTPITINTQE